MHQAKAKKEAKSKGAKPVRLQIRDRRKKEELNSYQAADEIIKNARLQHRHKLFVMWSGVTFFMLLIVAIWIFNVQGIFSSKVKRSMVEDEFQVDEIKELASDLGGQYGELKKIFEEASQTTTSLDILIDNDAEQKVELEFNPLPSFEESVEVDVKGVNSEDIELFKMKLLEMAEEK